MRTRDIMTSPVVTVAPDASLKDVAALLVERGINAVPVVDAVRADLEARLRNEIALLHRLRVEVAAGVVTVAGALGRQLVVGLARTVPGVVEVRSGDVQGPR